MSSILAWYFAPPDKRLAHGDGRLIRVGATHTVDCRPVLCKQGLHASVRPLDALSYASSPFVFRVRLSGHVAHGVDKCAATSRKYLVELNAEPLLRDFARKCAASQLHLWDAPPVVRGWLKTGNESLQSSAWSVARSAALSAAESAALSAAESVAWSAAESAALSAAESAALSAAESAAESAARSAARSAQNKLITRMLLQAIRTQKAGG